MGGDLDHPVYIQPPLPLWLLTADKGAERCKPPVGFRLVPLAERLQGVGQQCAVLAVEIQIFPVSLPAGGTQIGNFLPEALGQRPYLSEILRQCGLIPGAVVIEIVRIAEGRELFQECRRPLPPGPNIAEK